MRAKASSQVKSGYLFSLPVFSRAQREGGSHLVCDVIACPYIGALCFPQAESGTPITVLLGCAPLSAALGPATCRLYLSRGCSLALISIPQPQPTDGGTGPFAQCSLMSSPPPFPAGFLLCPQTGNLFPYLDDEASCICIVICPG